MAKSLVTLLLPDSVDLAGKVGRHRELDPPLPVGPCPRSAEAAIVMYRSPFPDRAVTGPRDVRTLTSPFPELASTGPRAPSTVTVPLPDEAVTSPAAPDTRTLPLPLRAINSDPAPVTPTSPFPDCTCSLTPAGTRIVTSSRRGLPRPDQLLPRRSPWIRRCSRHRHSRRRKSSPHRRCRARTRSVTLRGAAPSPLAPRPGCRSLRSR